MNNIFAFLWTKQILKHKKTKTLQAQVTIQDIIIHKHEQRSKHHNVHMQGPTEQYTLTYSIHSTPVLSGKLNLLKTYHRINTTNNKNALFETDKYLTNH